MTKDTRRLRFEVFPDGSRQVVDSTWEHAATTVACQKVTQQICPRCGEFIGYARHHMVRGSIHGDQYFHAPKCSGKF